MIWQTTYGQLQSFPPRYNLIQRTHISVNNGYANDIAGVIYWKRTIFHRRDHGIPTLYSEQHYWRVERDLWSQFLVVSYNKQTLYWRNDRLPIRDFAQSFLGGEHQSEYRSPISCRISFWLLSYCISPALLLHSTINKAIYSFVTARLRNSSVCDITNRQLSEPTATTLSKEDVVHAHTL